MNRRAWLATAAALAAPRAFCAAKRPRVGVVLPTTQERIDARSGFLGDYLRAFEAGLRERGWSAGKDVELLVRGGLPRDDAGTAIDGLKRDGIDVLMVWGNEPAQYAMRVAPELPVVAFLHFGIDAGVIRSLGRPGTNVTGVAIEQPGLAAKRLELLHTAAAVRRVARFYYSGRYRIGTLSEILPEYAEAGSRLGVEVFPLFAGTPDDVRHAMRELAAGPVRPGISTQMSPGSPHWQVFAEEVVRHRIPVIYDRDHAVAGGGLMSYGDDWALRFRQLAHRVDRILRGARPADLPIEQPTSFDLSVNLEAARAIGLVFPPAIMMLATRVVGGAR